MSEWQRLRLGDLIDIKHGYAFKGEYFSDDGDGPLLLTPGNFMLGGGFKSGKPKYYLGAVPDAFELAVGDLVVTMTDLSKSGDTLGYPAIIPSGPRYLHNQRIGLVIIRAPDKIDRQYLYSVLRTDSYRRHILAGATGSTVRHTSPSRIYDFEFAAPRLCEQQAIAAVLGALDDKIAVNDRVTGISRQLALSKFQAAVQNGNAIECELAFICEFLSRGVAPRYTDNPEQLLVLNQKCIRDGLVSFGPSRRTEKGVVPGQKLLQPNDIIVNSTGVGTLGRVARWLDDIPATVDSHVTIVRIDPNKADPVCAGFALLAAQQLIESLGEGSTGQTELSRARLGALTVRIPDGNATRHLRAELDALDARGKAALVESTTLAKLRDTLLPKLMSGEIRVREAEQIVEDAT